MYTIELMKADSRRALSQYRARKIEKVKRVYDEHRAAYPITQWTLLVTTFLIASPLAAATMTA